MIHCKVCGYRNRCTTKEYRKNKGCRCDLFWLDPDEYKKVEKAEMK